MPLPLPPGTGFQPLPGLSPSSLLFFSGVLTGPSPTIHLILPPPEPGAGVSFILSPSGPVRTGGSASVSASVPSGNKRTVSSVMQKNLIARP